ncbi:MAG: hypothetical protein NZM04_01860 [Methylacidiphilales bacterium]|nr:hypothetical protein [Candidatus Methylacidiphilales bacterium]MDW8348885.1 hypothetical protein [Verrucomicrobiae bacterium]
MKVQYLIPISVASLSLLACQPAQTEKDVLSKIKPEDLVRGESNPQPPNQQANQAPTNVTQPPQPMSLAELQARAAQLEINNSAIFEENKGQFGPGAETIIYRATGRDFQFYIRTDGWSNVLSQFIPDPNQPKEKPEPGRPPRPPTGRITTHRVDFQWINPNPNAIVEPQNPSQETRNFLGTQAGDIMGVRLFGNIKFRSLFNNIDLDISAPKNVRHHTYTLSPGANISDLKFILRYADDVKLENDKRMIVHTTLGELPYTLQIEQNGKEIDGKFILSPKGPPRPKSKKKDEPSQPGPDVEISIQLTGTVDPSMPYTVTLIEK